jgi:hypothetical protein
LRRGRGGLNIGNIAVDRPGIGHVEAEQRDAARLLGPL